MFVARQPQSAVFHVGEHMMMKSWPLWVAKRIRHLGCIRVKTKKSICQKVYLWMFSHRAKGSCDCLLGILFFLFVFLSNGSQMAFLWMSFVRRLHKIQGWGRDIAFHIQNMGGFVAVETLQLCYSSTSQPWYLNPSKSKLAANHCAMSYSSGVKNIFGNFNATTACVIAMYYSP